MYVEVGGYMCLSWVPAEVWSNLRWVLGTELVSLARAFNH